MNIQTLGKVVVPAAGTPVQVTTQRTPCGKVFVTQLVSATGKTYVGVAGMVSSTGVGVIRGFLPAGTAGQGDTFHFGGPGDSFDLSELYIDAAVSGEGLYIAYLVE